MNTDARPRDDVSPPAAPVADRSEAVARLRGALPHLREACGVGTIALFGSFARDQAGPTSDVDLLVTWERTPDFGRWVALREELVALLGRDVEIAERDLIDPVLVPRIAREEWPL